MGYFPICVDIRDKKVILVGGGPRSEDKMEKLRPFGPRLVRQDTLEPEDLTADLAFVVAGDLSLEEAQRVSRLCRGHGVPVNVVDRPALCTFFFPALITRGDLTVSVSTGGKTPSAAACLRRHIEETLTDETEAVLDWLDVLRRRLYARLPKAEAGAVLRTAASRAISLGRPLTDGEMMDISGEIW